MTVGPRAAAPTSWRARISVERAGLLAAGGLMTDYVLTVAVSVASGLAAAGRRALRSQHAVVVTTVPFHFEG